MIQLLALAALAATRPPDSLDAFHLRPERIETGIALTYSKSNIDGTHASTITWYFPDRDWIESFKATAGDPQATLVRARMNWKVFSVDRFESYLVEADGSRKLRASLDTDPEARVLRIDVGGQPATCPIEHFPWHSYDFDLASLVRVLPHLIDSEGAVEVGRADLVREPDPHFAWLGLITIEHGGDEEHEGRPCHVYEVGGPGLEERGGSLWIDRENGRLVDYEIELPDEPGFENGKMHLLRAEAMTPERWAEFVRERR